MDERPDYMDVVYTVHDEGYVDRFVSDSLSAAEKRKIGLAFTTDLVRRTFAEVAGTVYTAEIALAAGLAANLAGGTHHAKREGGSGFTVINDLAVAAQWLISRGRRRRVMV
jgi:acetoin utilization deacetylase AcuC-like enzyme